jgi:HAD superfamily hydrolase (TIGR01509 family)
MSSGTVLEDSRDEAGRNVPWAQIDTVLLDMDGTLLDLKFDNFFWLELLPERYAETRGLSAADARHELKPRFDAAAGTLAWYCLDHWSRELGLDLVALKHCHKHRIGYLPMVPEFLAALRRRGKRQTLVTNAHPQTLAVKTAVTGLHALVDEIVCAHDLAAAKESRGFWSALKRLRPFDPRRTLLIDDSLAVLDTAQSYGIRHVVAIRRPDSSRPPRAIESVPAVDGVEDLI